MVWQILKDGSFEEGEKIEYYKLPKRFKLLVTHYESEFTRIRSYKHLSPQIDRERFNGVLYKL